MTIQRLAFAAAVVAGLGLFAIEGEAHKPITSKYTYNDDVFPILKARCARCHVQGGVAPMSLMTYEEAFPWAESIRAELVAAHMPPAAADEGFGDVAHARALSAKEVDVILTWASGGNPRGALEQKLPPVELQNDWVLGKPDVALPLPSEFTLAADKAEETREFAIATGLTEPRWIRAVDLLPGNPAIVRSALIYVKGAPDRVLARWLPGQDPQPQENGAALRLPAGAELVARIRYKKTWSYEGKAMTDRSTVGLYFAPAGAREMTSVALPPHDVPAAGQTFAYDRALDGDVQLVAVDATEVPDDVMLQVEAVKPDGTRTPLLRFVTRSDWTRRYWLSKPMALPGGTKIEVKGTVEDPDLTSAAFGGPAAARDAKRPSVKLALDVVAGRDKPAAP
jgi:hypothetical protein